MEIDAAVGGDIGAEERRIAAARTALPAVVGRYRGVLADTGIGGEDARALGQQLWREAVADVASGHWDDRALYWARLVIRGQLDSAAARRQFEIASRGMRDVQFPDAGVWRVLLTGFDPFHLDDQIGQSNPSGLAALALDGWRFDAGRGPVQVETAIVPVRFADFDAGLIESFFLPHFEAGVELVLTVSMGRDAFDLERFPGRRRSSPVPDNLRVLTGASPAKPLVPRFAGQVLPGPEFVEFSLPVEAMQQVQGRWMVRDNRRVATLQGGQLNAPDLGSLAGQTAVAGSGGGYLSNEISFRTVRLVRALSFPTRIGHIHTPRVEGHQAADEQAMVAQIRALVSAAVAALQ